MKMMKSYLPAVALLAMFSVGFADQADLASMSERIGNQIAPVVALLRYAAGAVGVWLLLTGLYDLYAHSKQGGQQIKMSTVGLKLFVGVLMLAFTWAGKALVATITGNAEDAKGAANQFNNIKSGNKESLTF